MTNSNSFLKRSVLVLALGGLSLAAGAGAQDPDSTERRQDSTLAVARLAPLVVTGTAVPLSQRDLGLAATVISTAHLQAMRPMYAADVLRGTPGSHIDEAVGPGGPTIVRLRGGEEVFTQILADGVQINQNGGFFDLQGFPLTNIERVEVVRGPQSVLYGSSAVSGAVQYITRRGTVGAPRIEAMAEGGTAQALGGTFRSSVALGGGIPSLLYSGGIGLSYNRGIHAVPHDTWTRDFSARLDAVPSSKWDLAAVVRYIDVESNLPVRDPGATRVPLDSNALDARDRFVSSLEAAFHPQPDWENRLRLAVYREDFLFLDEFDDVASSGDYDFFIFDADFTLDSRLWRTTADYLGTHHVRPQPGSEFSISYGARVEREDLSDRTTGDFGDSEQQLDRVSTAAFTELQAELAQRLGLLAGLRIEKYEGLDAEVTPRASLLFRLVPGSVGLRGAAGRAYKAPNLQQQYLDNPFIVSNPGLAPETSISWEVGLELDLAGGMLGIDVGYFRQSFDGLIQLAPVENDTRLTYQNLSSSRVQGIESRLRFAPSARVAVGISANVLDSKVLDNAGQAADAFPVDSALPFRPEFTGAAYLQWQPISKLSTTVNIRRVGSQIVLSERFSGQRVEMEPYTLVGIVLDYSVRPWVGIYTRIDNLLNTAYETAFDQPGASRTWAVGMQVRN